MYRKQKHSSCEEFVCLLYRRVSSLLSLDGLPKGMRKQDNTTRDSLIVVHKENFTALLQMYLWVVLFMERSKYSGFYGQYRKIAMQPTPLTFILDMNRFWKQ